MFVKENPDRKKDNSNNINNNNNSIKQTLQISTLNNLLNKICINKMSHIKIKQKDIRKISVIFRLFTNLLRTHIYTTLRFLRYAARGFFKVSYHTKEYI